jgi:adenylate cyclase
LSEGERRLAAIMFTDMVGYTALGQKNESLSLALVEEQKKLIRPILARHNGKEIKTIGDAFLVEFPNAVDAVRCAYDIQRAIREFNLSLASDRRIHLRIGVHVGEVVESQGDISGDTVNVASRIEPLAEDGAVCITRQVYDHVKSKIDLSLTSLGPKSLKNVREPMEVYKMVMPWEKEIVEMPIRLDAKRIAVLPFVSMSPDPNDEYFADGMTEELISSISNIGDLSVISRTSVMKFKRGGKTASEIGQELKVGTLLEGSVRKADSFVRVTAQLVDVKSDKHLWSQNYDRELKNIFALQSDIAKQIADILRVKVLSQEKDRIARNPTNSTTAYTLYLKGKYHLNKRHQEDLTRALEYFRQSVEDDPSFALGYAGEADCHLLLRDDWAIDTEANFEKAKMMVSRALDIDPSLAEAHATRGLLLCDEFKLREAEEEYKRAIELKPSYSTAHQWYQLNVLCPEMRWDEAQEQIEKALELDPLSPVINFNHALLYDAKREYEKALELYNRVLELDPRYPAHGFMMWVYGRMKRFDRMDEEASTFVEQMQKIFPAKLWVDMCRAFCKDDNETLSSLLPELETHINGPFQVSFPIACCYFKLGQKDKGFEWLERSLSKKESSLLGIMYDPDLDGVRTDPRYLDLLKKLGLN